MLVEAADAGVVELETSPEAIRATRLKRFAGCALTDLSSSEPRLAARLIALSSWRLSAGRICWQARFSSSAGRPWPRNAVHSSCRRWCPKRDLDDLRGRLETLGGGVVVAPQASVRRAADAATDAPGGRAFSPLVEIYGTARYPDIDPTPFTAISFVLMFGMMFADAGHGLLLCLAGLFLRFSRIRGWLHCGEAGPFLSPRPGRHRFRRRIRRVLRADRVDPGAVAAPCCGILCSCWWRASSSARSCSQSVTRSGLSIAAEKEGSRLRSTRALGSRGPLSSPGSGSRCSHCLVGQQPWPLSFWPGPGHGRPDPAVHRLFRSGRWWRDRSGGGDRRAFQLGDQAGCQLDLVRQAGRVRNGPRSDRFTRLDGDRCTSREPALGWPPYLCS